MKVEREKGSGKSLQEAIEDIHKRVALDEIQKKVARRSGGERPSAEGLSKGERSTGSQMTGPSASSRSPALIGSGTGTGTGPGSGIRDRNRLGRVPLGIFLAGVETE